MDQSFHIQVMTIMSHDRGCWKCGRDIWGYKDCARENRSTCAKYILVREWYPEEFGKPRYRIKAGSRRINNE